MECAGEWVSACVCLLGVNIRAYAASLGAKVSVLEHVLACVADATGWGVEISVWALAIVCLGRLS